MFKRGLIFLYYWPITMVIKLLNVIGFSRDKSKIPQGYYCYEFDGLTSNGYKIKPCKYYKYKVACTYIGYYGDDPVFADQCKICGINKDYENENRIL